MSTDACCKRISRICCKISELLNHEIEGDLEEFLTNIQSIFLVLCEYLHADIECLEMISGKDRCDDVYNTAHRNVELLYEQLNRTVARNRASLVYEAKEWFAEGRSTELSGRFPSLTDSPKGKRRPVSPVIPKKIFNALFTELEGSTEIIVMEPPASL